MIPLIDADILLHELGWSGQFKDKESGEEILLDFEFVAEMLDEKIKLICLDVDATEPPILFITDSEWLNKQTNRLRKWKGEPEKPFFKGFRYGIAVTKPYKGTRNNPKPFHFYNIIAYLMANYNVIISEDGYEADDMMTMMQYGREDTIICSRDKDLRICPGWHFSWECGQQRSIGPHFTDRIGSLNLVRKLDPEGKVKSTELKGYGLKFFYSQMLTGDVADNIPGLPKVGAVFAYDLLNPLTTEYQLYEVVKTVYIEKVGEGAKEYFMEQATLLWMAQEQYVPYKIPKKGTE